LELLKLSKEKESVVFGDAWFCSNCKEEGLKVNCAKREVQSEEGLKVTDS